MKILKEIKLNNFLSHVKTEIKFDSDQKTLIDGMSGAGKSSITESIVWGLYGKGRSDNKALIRHGTKKATVEIVLVDGNAEYKITRSISDGNKHTLKVEELISKKFTPIKALGIKGVQEHLEKKILKSSYLLFVNSIVYLQENIDSFVKQTAAKRKDIILEIINSVDYDTYLKKAKTEIQKNKTELEVNESRIEDRKRTVVNNKQEAENLQTYIEDKDRVVKEIDVISLAQKELLKKKDAILEKITVLNKEKGDLDTIIHSIDTIKLKIEEFNSKIIDIQSIDYTSLENDVKKLENLKKMLLSLEITKEKTIEWSDKMNLLQSEIPQKHDYKADEESINKEIIEIMGENVPTCAKCGTVYALFEENKQKRINALSLKLSHVRSQFIAYNESLTKYESKINDLGPKPDFDAVRIKELRDEIGPLLASEMKLLERKSKEELVAVYVGEIEVANKELLLLEENKLALEKRLNSKNNDGTELDNIKLEINKNSTFLQNLNSENAELQGKLSLAEVAKSNIDKSEEEIKNLLKEVNQQKEDNDCLQIMKEAFGPNGIKSIVIDYVIPQLEDEINKILSKLSDFRIKLETQKSGLTEGALLEGLFITIINDVGNEMDYSAYSGGEKIKITMSIFEGLSSIQKFGFRFFDESVIGLDGETVDSFTNVMLQLQEDVNQMFCISHLSQVKDLFDNKITVVKNNGISKII